MKQAEFFYVAWLSEQPETATKYSRRSEYDRQGVAELHAIRHDEGDDWAEVEVVLLDADGKPEEAPLRFRCDYVREVRTQNRACDKGANAEELAEALAKVKS